MRPSRPVPATCVADMPASASIFAAAGIATLMVWTGNVLRQPGFASIDHRAPAGGFPNADRVMDRALSLPCHHALSSDDLGYLLESLTDVLSH